jgi:DNA repair protein RadA/Sms
MGKCHNCGTWNSYVEEVVQPEPKSKPKLPGLDQKIIPVLLDTISYDEMPRIDTRDPELNRVLGGGIVPGSLVLLGGEPGIGKSTLLLQIALLMQGTRVLYVSGEESEQQLKMRATRLSGNNPELYVYTETTVEGILQEAEKLQPGLVVIDSIQTLQTLRVESVAGSVAQIREATALLQQYAKRRHVPVMIVGHITKEGVIAGPKLLEHMVDTVLQFEGDRNYVYRLLRTIKNRFGSTAELGIYEMQGSGLRPVANPSELLLTTRDEPVSGIAIAATMEGMRVLMVEVQALVSTAVYGTPQRSSNGYDLRRLNMILAVLDKRCGFHFLSKDVFLNIAGGLRIEDPAADLAVVAALLSSYHDHPISDDVAFAGEVGLSGEIRPVQNIGQRVAEVDKLGYERLIISKYNPKIEAPKGDTRLILSKKVEELTKMLF